MYKERMERNHAALEIGLKYTKAAGAYQHEISAIELACDEAKIAILTAPAADRSEARVIGGMEVIGIGCMEDRIKLLASEDTAMLDWVIDNRRMRVRQDRPDGDWHVYDDANSTTITDNQPTYRDAIRAAMAKQAAEQK